MSNMLFCRASVATSISMKELYLLRKVCERRQAMKTQATTAAEIIELHCFMYNLEVEE